MADFKKQGGSLSGREERYDGFEGEPRAVGGALSGSSTTGTGMTGSHGHNTAGPHSSNLDNKLDPRVDSDMDGSRRVGGNAGTGSTGTGYGSGTTGSGYGTDGAMRGTGSSGTTGTSTTGKKPGLMDRLNPMKDTDGDGKKGFME